jgi:hypothetical protein
LFELIVAAHITIRIPTPECDLSVARVELLRLLEIGERIIPAVLAAINPGRDKKGFGIIR